MSEHYGWRRGGDRDGAAVAEGYAVARRAHELGRAVRERRDGLGLSQAEVAARAGMTRSALSRLEAGGAGVPTIGVLERVARALDAELVVTLEAHVA
ncbi:helix-turn-helix domain-containing protein [Actinocorallia sp. API 0066]|uniref:helix-turn-helix domain-containing protein n=1 Tax=Actinocorallia sp. API 0066 TaxID=2896846 RepID=UPI001E2DDBA1|nr:helix-turn-helix transcriptional regulator [Actinocorallia sp. API 0066]MCD0451455.1 helix-turn-helix domain-containing protein [Actinocorallia sp. API 0066]